MKKLWALLVMMSFIGIGCGDSAPSTAPQQSSDGANKTPGAKPAGKLAPSKGGKEGE